MNVTANKTTRSFFGFAMFFGGALDKAASRCEAAQAKGQGYASEKACFEDTHVQSGTDLVGRRIPRRKRSPRANQLLTPPVD